MEKIKNLEYFSDLEYYSGKIKKFYEKNEELNRKKEDIKQLFGMFKENDFADSIFLKINNVFNLNKGNKIMMNVSRNFLLLKKPDTFKFLEKDMETINKDKAISIATYNEFLKKLDKLNPDISDLDPQIFQLLLDYRSDNE